MKKELTVLRHILRIITPGEISDLTKTSNGRKQVSLTEILKVHFDGRPLDDAWDRPEGQNQETSPKILPFKNSKKTSSFKKNVKSKDFVHIIGKRVLSFLNNFISEEKASEGDLFKTKKNKRWSDKSKNESSEFVLFEQSKYKNSDNRLKSQNIFNLYEKTSQIDHSESKSDLSKSDTLGNLINKKSA